MYRVVAPESMIDFRERPPISATYRTNGNDIVGPVGGQFVESVLLLSTAISFLRIQSQLLVLVRLGILQLHGLEIRGITPIVSLIFILLPYVLSICVWCLGIFNFQDLAPFLFHSRNIHHGPSSYPRHLHPPSL